MVNLFTRSSYVAVRGMMLPAEPRARVQVISRLRDQEDQLFADAARLARHNLGLWEPPLMGRRPFDLADLGVEVAALSNRLMPCILSMLPDNRDARKTHLYCPMGIGGHRNHISTLLAIRHAYDVIRDRCTLFLYEDLHYASVRRARQDGVQRARQIFARQILSPMILPINSNGTKRKMQFISIYASQHAAPPREADYTPASGIDGGPHEIVWKVSTSTGGQT